MANVSTAAATPTDEYPPLANRDFHREKRITDHTTFPNHSQFQPPKQGLRRRWCLVWSRCRHGHPHVNKLDYYSGLATAVPALWVIYLYVRCHEYRNNHKTLLILNFILTNFVCQLLQTPLRLHKIYDG
jgi:hypothetical protein